MKRTPPTAHRASVQDGDAVVGWIGWEEGNLGSAYPDERTFARLLELADHFGAQVQGDDGEFYRTQADFPGIVPSNDQVRPRGGVLAPYLHRARALEWAAIVLAALAVVAANLLEWW